MMRITVIASGSMGNAVLVSGENTSVLIDAGTSASEIEAYLEQIGMSPSALAGVLVTHEHGDHTGALAGLKRFPHLRIFANDGTRRVVQAGLTWRADWQVFETGCRFRYRDLEVDTFAVPHDAQDPVGFRFSHGHEGDLVSPRRSLVWLTDLGHAPLNVRQCIRECDVIVVESNHCPRLLQADTKRPWATKQRIAGRHGHLSNEAVRELLADVASPRWRHIFLTHLSRDCNSRAAVEEALAGVRAALGSCRFSVVEQGETTPWLELA